ncbi:MAG TPA: class I SAM-dependent methyltransferase [Xanthobacteraceae bacterium]|nr:class I SAM-dependent methyltransferase [Xanthobacteraceae bacterium]
MSSAVSAVEIDSWYHGKDLAFDWTSRHIPLWLQILAPLRTRSVKVLEIGSFEGRSALFFVNYLPHSTLVCIDAWDASVVDLDVVERMPEAAGAPDKMAWAVEEFLKVQRRFDCNLAPFGDRVTKVVGWSHEALAELGVGGETFDVIYVDGDHRALGAYADCVLAWPLLAPDGIMIIDDYGFMPDLPKDKRPQAGVDRFLETIPGRYDELHRDYQLVVRATSRREIK